MLINVGIVSFKITQIYDEITNNLFFISDDEPQKFVAEKLPQIYYSTLQLRDAQ